ncbi:MAG: hypothetical protein HQ596_01765 [Candidatus Saganbacteria bacterium]|nr:hypothetical protein [Candidatus Saganbacteria bacterium]
MKIISNKREGNKILLEIEEDYPKFSEAIDKTLNEAGKEMNIPGFRPGKAPKKMIEQAINREVLETQAAHNLISDLYPQIISETKIEPVDYPKVDIVSMAKDKPLVFKISVDVYPEVTLGKYKGLKVEKDKVALGDEDVVKVLENLKTRMEKPGPDGKKPEIALDDEFAKKVSKFSTLVELKEEVKQSMLKDREARADSEVKNKLIAEASHEANVEIPAGMIEHEIDIMVDELRSSLSQSGLTLEDYLKGIKKEEKAMRAELSKSAEIRLKGKVVLRAIALAEKMEVSEEVMDKELKGIADATGEGLSDLKKRLDEGARKHIEDYMLRRCALDFISEKAKIKEVDSKFSEVRRKADEGEKKEEEK